MRNLILIFLASSCLFSCDDSSDLETPVTITITHKVGADDLVFDNIQYVNPTGEEYSVETLKYFLSQIKLGNEFVVVDPVYVDARDPNTLTIQGAFVLTQSSYNTMSLHFGIPEILNVRGTYLKAPESNMEWPRAMGDGNNSGYHYMKFEGKFNSSIGLSSYATHTGPSMNTDYSIADISFSDLGITTTGKKITINLTMDLNQWYKNPNTYSFEGKQLGIMGDADLQTQLQANGRNVFSIASITIDE